MSLCKLGYLSVPLQQRGLVTWQVRKIGERASMVLDEGVEIKRRGSQRQDRNSNEGLVKSRQA